jgi:hypothetical protein
MGKRYNSRQVRDTVVVYSLYQKRSAEFYEADKRGNKSDAEKIAKEILNEIIPKIKKDIPEEIQESLGIHVNSLENIFNDELKILEEKRK